MRGREPMPAYVVITREKTRNADRLEQYRKLAPASFEQHPVTFRAIHGRHEVLEGPASGGCRIRPLQLLLSPGCFKCLYSGGA